MSDNNKMDTKNGLVMKLLSILFIVFGILCVIVSFISKKYLLLLSALGFVLLTITMNIASKFKVNKYNSKTVSIICAIFELISIPLIFVYVIYSYVLLVPALILSKKVMQCSGKNKTGLILFLLSVLIIIACLISSIIAYI